MLDMWCMWDVKGNGYGGVNDWIDHNIVTHLGSTLIFLGTIKIFVGLASIINGMVVIRELTIDNFQKTLDGIKFEKTSF